MKCARVEVDGTTRWGIVRDGAVELLDGSPYDGGQPDGPQRPLGGVRLLAPVTPSKIFCLGRNYAAHRSEMGYEHKTAALELRPAAVRVNAICPGFADTDLVTSQKGVYEQALGLPSFDALIEQAQGGYVTLEDIARLTVFLASERSRFCTGGAYVVDGGLTASLL